MELVNDSYKKIVLLLTLFVGGLIWFLLVFFARIIMTNLSGKSIWPKSTRSEKESGLSLSPINNQGYS